VVGSATALVAAGTTTVAALNARTRRRARIDGSNPSGPAGSRLPEGRSLVVPTDDGAHLAVTIAGPEDGPTVVLAHCWTGSRAIWATVARRLALGGHRVVLYDQRGHGQSTNSDSLPSIDGLGHDLRTVLEATDATDAVLVGHSMGGMTIQSYAALHPEDFEQRARSVVLVATAARTLGRTVPGRVVHRALGDGRQEWTRRGRVGRALVRGSLGQQARRAHVDLTLETFAATTGVARAGYLVAMAAMDLREGLANITVPTTVLVGTRDRLTPVRSGRQLAAAIPDADLVILPGAGHMLPLEAPDRIIDAVRSTSRRAAARERGDQGAPGARAAR
jgi:pimeloyl-ACP methyl ester carboxylesterase